MKEGFAVRKLKRLNVRVGYGSELFNITRVGQGVAKAKDERIASISVQASIP